MKNQKLKELQVASCRQELAGLSISNLDSIDARKAAYERFELAAATVFQWRLLAILKGKDVLVKESLVITQTVLANLGNASEAAIGEMARAEKRTAELTADLHAIEHELDEIIACYEMDRKTQAVIAGLPDISV